MKHLLWIFSVVFITVYLFTESWATEAPKTNEIDALLAKVSKNIESASQATAMAKEVNEKLIEQKAKEKEQLKAKVENMELVVEKMEDKMEIYAVKMIGSGIDTAVDEVEFKGPAYEAWLNYVEEGGKEDFGYFRLYIWQQK